MLYIFVDLIYKLLVGLVFNMASTCTGICLILGLRVSFKSCFTAAMQPINNLFDFVNVMLNCTN